MNITQAARALGVSASTVRRWRDAGLISHRRMGRRTIFDEREIERVKRQTMVVSPVLSVSEELVRRMFPRLGRASHDR